MKSQVDFLTQKWVIETLLASQQKTMRIVFTQHKSLKNDLLIERLLHLTQHLHLVDSQHGFRPLHSTTSALLHLAHRVARGFNKQLPRPLRTVVLAVDLSKAFDTVPHDGFISLVSSTQLLNNMVR